MTYQPPGGAPPEPTPYAQPQDPWAGGHEPGVAAAPTDPIPQQGFGAGQYAPGVASPSVWTQETMAAGGPYGYAPPPQKSRIGVYLLVFLAIIVLGGGGGYGAYYVITHRNTGNTPQGQSTSTVPVDPTTNASTPNPTSTLDPATVKKDDCLFNSSQDDDNPVMKLVQCGTSGSYKVLKIASGASIPEGPNGKFDRDHTSVAVCANTDYKAWYAWDSEDNNKDYFFCLSAKTP